jgi:hypothetical protein
MSFFANIPKYSFIFNVKFFFEKINFPKITAHISKIILCQTYYLGTVL